MLVSNPNWCLINYVLFIEMQVKIQINFGFLLQVKLSNLHVECIAQTISFRKMHRIDLVCNATSLQNCVVTVK